MRTSQSTYCELTNLPITLGMGNVLRSFDFSEMSTVSDKKIPVDDGNNGTIDWYMADITSASDYYPFGSPMDGRTFRNTKYRFGFNGKENDDEIKGDGNSLDFGARIFDSRLGRWLAVDPEFRSYPSNSGYCFAIDNPIMFEDFDGGKIRFSLAFRLFHKTAYKVQLEFLKSDIGKEIYREYATAKQAKKYWGDNNGKGKLSDNVDVVFDKQDDSGGEDQTFLKIDGKWVDVQDVARFSSDQMSKINNNTKGRIIVSISESQPYTTDTEDNITGDVIFIMMAVGHEATVHVKFETLFFMALKEGFTGDKLKEKYNNIYLPDLIDNQHIAACIGVNESYNNFIDWYKKYAQEKGASQEKIDRSLDVEDHYNNGGGTVESFEENVKDLSNYKSNK